MVRLKSAAVIEPVAIQDTVVLKKRLVLCDSIGVHVSGTLGTLFILHLFDNHYRSCATQPQAAKAGQCTSTCIPVFP